LVLVIFLLKVFDLHLLHRLFGMIGLIFDIVVRVEQNKSTGYLQWKQLIVFIIASLV